MLFGDFGLSAWHKIGITGHSWIEGQNILPYDGRSQSNELNAVDDSHTRHKDLTSISGGSLLKELIGAMLLY